MELINLKIKLNNHSEFIEAWDLLTKIGYINGGKPYTCPYLYGHSNGHLGYDFFDPEDADLENPNSAKQYFINKEYEEVTLEILRNMAESIIPKIKKTSFSSWGVDIHMDHNGVAVTHNEWVETENGDQQLTHGHFYDIIVGGQITPVRFQHGPVKEYGVNGITSEALLAILIHRTKVLDNNFPCEENKCSITYMENALALFNKCTADRQRRGVEGQNKL